MATIDQLQLDIIVNNKGTVARINSVNRALEKLNKTVASSGNLSNILGGVTGGTGGKSSKIGGVAKNVSNISKSLGFGKILGKLYFIRNYTKQLGRGLANVVQQAMDYVETQNLWQVANRENIAGAKEFVSIMSKAYGISTKNLMNYQAIFKNMLSALGNLSDVVSTTLSEQLTQFALDFSSLYNVSIESAMQKFQAVLSGQVRPIRSVSGYDITENTIFDIYKQMGGEKTMRQLSQIEKRLLRIYAVFDQMSGTGAIGDMSKTIETAANQSRIMNEQFSEMTMWLGQSILMWMNEAKILQNVNALLITMKEIFKSLAYAGGYEEPVFDNIFDSATEAGDAVDELTGKLFSFDKFEALNQADTGTAGIDPKIEELLTKITTQTQLQGFEAQKIADSWLKQIGLGKEMYKVLYKNGEIITMTAEEYANLTEEQKKQIQSAEVYREISDKFKNILDTLKAIVIPLGVILGLGLVYKIGKFVGLLMKSVFYTNILKTGIVLLAIGIGSLISSWGDMGTWQKIITIFVSLAAAIGATAVALSIFKGNWVKALAVGATVAGAGLLIGSQLSKNTPKFATGGFPEDGLFYANSGELVGGFSNGKTAVANNAQIVEGIKQGVKDAMIETNTLVRGIYNEMGECDNSSSIGFDKSQFVSWLMPEVDNYNRRRGVTI